MADERDLVFELTRRVNSGGGYLNLLLRYRLDRSDMDARDRALVTEMTYGIQRHRNRLDYIIRSFSSRSLERIQPEVLDMLRMGVYQISMMRIPRHAAVNETVESTKRLVGLGAASFVNAVLRKTAENLGDLAWPPREELGDYLESVHSHPRWLVEYLLDSMDGREAEALCIADNSIPSLTLRVNTAMIDRDVLTEKIVEQGGKASASSYLRESLREVDLPYEAIMDFIHRGYCVIQDESSMLVGHAVNPLPGGMVVDACAAPGGKCTHLALLGGASCSVIAMDKNPARLKALSKSVSRQGLKNIDILEGDASRMGEILTEKADAVLVDAPCSGLGTLQRNPELKWRRNPEDISPLAGAQLELLEGCAESVRPGGALVYSVCTFTREETRSIIEEFTSRRNDFHLEGLAPYLPSPFKPDIDDEGHIQLMPHIHSMEGMYIARLARKR